ncbi:MAG: Na/Pi cotransporter family protein [Oscillospiraceae bacterium]|nr:Na/Pi cotransporter family protein [Oscillospiraceae bacterium]
MPKVVMDIITVGCGLALFLYGMKLMGEGLEAAAGSKFKKILEWVTKNRLIGVLTGTLITAVIQSSSATTVMVVGFVNSGLLQLSQAVGVIMGANIGTTVTGLIVSLKISEIAPIAVILGILLIIGSKKVKFKHAGYIIGGLGILFLGMTMMGDTLKPLADNESALALFEKVQNPFLGIFLGLLFTALIQSSSATIGILIVLGNSGILTLDSGIYMIYGACIGTCVTAIIASVGASRAAKRVSVVHFCFNTIGTVVFAVITILPLGYVDFLKNLIGDDIGRQIAVATVIFKVAMVVLLFPFANVLVKIANFVIPVKEDEMSTKRLLHLDSRIFSMPHIAVEQTRLEVERMAKLALDNYRLSVDMFLNRDTKNVEKIKKNEELINFLNHEITKYLIRINTLELESNDRKLIGSFFHIVNDIERIGDHAENIMEFSIPFIEEKKMFSQDAVDELKKLTTDVENVIESSIKYFSEQVYNQEEIDRIDTKEEEVDEEVEQFTDNHILRLNEGVCTPTSGMLFVNMLSDLERISDHAKNIVTSLHARRIKQAISKH